MTSSCARAGFAIKITKSNAVHADTIRAALRNAVMNQPSLIRVFPSLENRRKRNLYWFNLETLERREGRRADRVKIEGDPADELRLLVVDRRNFEHRSVVRRRRNRDGGSAGALVAAA